MCLFVKLYIYEVILYVVCWDGLLSLSTMISRYIHVLACSFFFTAELYFIVRTHTHLFICIWNPMDRGAWWATVHMVAKSWAPLKQLSIAYLDDHIKSYKHHPNRADKIFYRL